MARRVVRGSLLAAVVGLSSACPATNSVYGTQGGGHSASTGARTGAAAGVAASSSTAGTTGAGGTTGGSSSGMGSTGTTGFVDSGCNLLSDTDETPLTDCPPSDAELLTEVLSICALGGSTLTPGIQLTNLSDVSEVGDTDACGRVHVCVPPGSTVTGELKVTGAAPELLAPILVNHSIGEPPVYLMCSTLLGDLSDEAVGQGLSSAAAYVGAFVTPLRKDDTVETKDFPDAGCYDHSGWSFALFGPDGGLISDTPLYLTGIGGSNGDAGTSAFGLAVFFNLDPALGSVTAVGTRPGNALPDGGVRCGYASPQIEFTGEITLQASYLSMFPYAVQPTDPSGFAVPGSLCVDSSCLGGAHYLACVSGTCCGDFGFACTQTSDCCHGLCITGILPDGGDGPLAVDGGVCGG